jgi:hypothetical protein
METSAVATRLAAVHDAAHQHATVNRWRREKDGDHPVFQAVTDEALAILSEFGITPTAEQTSTLAWIARGELHTLVHVVEMIVSGRPQ